MTSLSSASKERIALDSLADVVRERVTSEEKEPDVTLDEKKEDEGEEASDSVSEAEDEQEADREVMKPIFWMERMTRFR